jgi:hypothetical protein
VKELKGTLSYLSETKLTQIESMDLCNDLLEYEKTQVVNSMKIGILYVKEGDVTEEHMFSNGNETL